MESSDALFLLGVILSDTNFSAAMREIDMRHAIIAAERQVRLGFHTYAEVPLRDLVEAMAAAARPSGIRPQLPEPPAPPYGLAADESPISPTDIATAVNDMMEDHGVMPMASDMGDCLFTAMDIAQHSLAAPGYYAGMGFGVPGGLGVQVATGERPLILVGDGAFQMTGWELGNCRRYGWDPIVIVFNNASWEMLRAFQPEAGFNDLPTGPSMSWPTRLAAWASASAPDGSWPRPSSMPWPTAAASCSSTWSWSEGRSQTRCAASCDAFERRRSQ